jgi:hypothetical protein
LAKKQNFVIEPCVYNQPGQEAKINSITPPADEKLNSLDYCFRKAEKERLDFLFKVFSLAPVLKHPKFAEEKEWRLISKDQSICKNRLRFREGNSMIIPYIEFDLLAGNKSLPIKKIFVGPTPGIDLSRESLRDLLSANEIDPSVVHKTGIPYRYW